MHGLRKARQCNRSFENQLGGLLPAPLVLAMGDATILSCSRHVNSNQVRSMSYEACVLESTVWRNTNVRAIM